MKQTQKGFTLIELMIVVAIIGILAAVAIPAYSTYTKKAKFTEVVQATQALKTGIESCYGDMGDMNLCYAGTNGVPQPVLGAVNAQPTYAAGATTAVPASTQGGATATFGKYVNYVVVYPADSTHTSILAGATNANGLTGETIRLDGTATGQGITWTTNGTPTISTCLADQICKQ